MPAIHAPTRPFDDLLRSGATATDVLTHGGAEGWKQLLSNRKLKALTVHQLTDDKTALLGELKHLESLDIQGCDAADLTALAGIPNLRSLSIFTAPRLRDFSFLGQLKNLESLKVTYVTKLKDVGVLEKLPELRTLAVAKLFSWVALPSLASFGKLNQLRVLEIGFDAKDGSLAPLANLSGLKELSLPLSYALEEYARLVSSLPQIICATLEKPYGLSSSVFFKCKRCGGLDRITLAKGRRGLCPKCDHGKFQAYLQEYEALKSSFGGGLNGRRSEPGGAANRSQPLVSETHRTPARAGSRCRPLR